MSKKKIKKQNPEILIQIEEYMQENDVSDFSDLPILLRMEHEEFCHAV